MSFCFIINHHLIEKQHLYAFMMNQVTFSTHVVKENRLMMKIVNDKLFYNNGLVEFKNCEFNTITFQNPIIYT